MPTPIEYGKVITEETIVKNKIVAAKRSVEQSKEVSGQLGALAYIGASIKEMKRAQNHKMSFEIIADPETNEPVRVVKRYQAERS